MLIRLNNRERGIALPFLAISAVALFGLVALAIDGMMAANAREQAENASELAALAMLERWVALENQGLSDRDRLEQGLLRAGQVAGLNSMMGFYDSNPLGRFGLWISGCTESWCEGGNPGGDVLPGQWFSDLNPDGTNPCDPETPPCFIHGDDEAGPFNAIRIQTRSFTPLRTLFASVLGQETLAIAGEGTAALRSRHGVILADLSLSTQQESHPFNNPPCDAGCQADLDSAAGPPPPPPGSWYYEYGIGSGYDWVRGIRSSYTHQIDPPGSACPSTNPFPDQVSVSPANYYDCLWTALEPARYAGPPWDSAIGSLDLSQKKTFQDDYSAETFSVVDYRDGAPETKTFRYDTVTRPEPLASIIEGVHELAKQFKTRRVAGDSLGFIGYDGFIPTDPNLHLRLFELSDNFDPIIDATDYQAPNPASNPNSYLNNFLFPVVAPTDTYVALEKAISDLTQMTGAQDSSSFVLLFSDGLPNCVDDAGARDCSSQYSFFQGASDEIRNNLIPSLQAQEIPVHVVLFGESTHTMLYKSYNSPDCMNDEESRALNVDYVDGSCSGGDCNQDYNLMLGGISNFFPAVAEARHLAVATKGIFAPIRPCCQSGGSCADVTPYLNAQCSTGTHFYPNPPTPVVALPHSDGQGRLLCDGQGRNLSDQVKDAINEITQFSPLILVGKRE